MANQQQHHVFISVGTSSGYVLAQLKRELEKFSGEHAKSSRFIALDTSESIEKLKDGGILPLCMGKELLHGDGSGMRPMLANRAFYKSQEEFLNVVGPPEEIAQAIVVGAPGRGGSAAGMFLPCILTLRSQGIITTAFVIEPANTFNSVGPIQRTFCVHVGDQLKRHGIKGYFANEDWLFEKFKEQNLTLTSTRQLMYEQFARSIATNFLFSTGGGEKISFLDRNDLRYRVLQGDGYLKFADAKVDLKAPDPVSEVKRAFKEITDHNLFRLEGSIGAVIVFYHGEWGTGFHAALNQEIAAFVEQRDTCGSKGLCFRKGVDLESRFLGVENEGHLAIMFSTAAVEMVSTEEDFPEPEPDEVQAELAVPEVSASAKSGAPSKLLLGLQRPLSASYGSFEELLNAAIAKGGSEAMAVLSKGSPLELTLLVVRHKGQSLPIFRFPIMGPELGRGLIEYRQDDRQYRDSILLEKLLTARIAIGGFSPQWMDLFSGSILQALKQGKHRLPRYLANTLFQRNEPQWDELTPNLLRENPLWRELRRREPYMKEGQPKRAWLSIVRAAMQNFFEESDFESEYREVMEPVDSRTHWQMAKDSVRTSIHRYSFGLLCKPMRTPVDEPVPERLSEGLSMLNLSRMQTQDLHDSGGSGLPSVPSAPPSSISTSIQ